MKIVFISTLILACAFSVSAKDACSPQIKGYITGLETGTTLSAINKVQRDKAIKQIEYIKDLQTKLADCEVIDFIPELKASKEALKFTSSKVNAQG